MRDSRRPLFTWFNPTEVIFGTGALLELSSVVDRVVGPEGRVFLVTGRRSLHASGVLQLVIDSLGPKRVTLFDQVTPLPSPEHVDYALDACRRASADVVVAIGGGSALDLAKAVAILMTHDGTSREFASGQKTFERSGLPFIAAPTTSGSSSEVTPSAALWDIEARRSMNLRAPTMFPKVALVDPELTMTMHKGLAAVTGMDAFTSAFESYWSTEAEPISEALNLHVIRTFADNLERSCNEGDLESRSACALAATMSGIAYSNSKTNVCHAVGSPLTLYWGVEHGQAVSITLAAFLNWNAPVITHKLQALWDALGVTGLEEAIVRILQIMDRCGLQTRLKGLGLVSSDVEILVEQMRWDRVESLSRPLGRTDVRAIFQNLM